MYKKCAVKDWPAPLIGLHNLCFSRRGTSRTTLSPQDSERPIDTRATVRYLKFPLVENLRRRHALEKSEHVKHVKRRAMTTEAIFYS